MERFKGTPIPNFPGYYATEEGKIYSSTNWRGYGLRELTPSINNDGYMVVRLTTCSKTRKKASVHKLIAITFLGERLGLQVRHLNGNKLDNSASNLKWGTALENAGDRLSHQTTATGSRIGTSKLTESDILEIRSRYKGWGSATPLANLFQVSIATISYIVTNKTWKGVGNA